MRTPKLQLLNNHRQEDARTHQKMISHVQRQRRSWNKMIGRVQSWSNQVPYLLGGWPTDWNTVVPKMFSHCFECSEIYIKLPSLGIGQSDCESPGNQILKEVEFDYSTSTGLEETEAPLLEGTNKTLCKPRPRGKSSDLIGDWSRPTC